MAVLPPGDTLSAPPDPHPSQTAAISEEQVLLEQSATHRLTTNTCLRRWCGWAFRAQNCLSVALVLQALVGTARLLTPRPLVAIANFFLAFLGLNPTHSPAVVRLFFLSFFSLIVGLSDLFWLIVKFTGPFGSSWLNPEYYWRPLYPSIYENVYVTTTAHDTSQKIGGSVGLPGNDAPGGGLPMHEHNGEKPTLPASTKLVPLSKIFPPEKPPAIWRIYVELVCLCINPLLCLVTSWLAWILYKRIMAQIHAAEISYFTPADERMDYGSAAPDSEVIRSYGDSGGVDAHISGRTAPLSLPIHHTDRTISQQPHGPHGFVPFAGQGRRLGNETSGAESEV